MSIKSGQIILLITSPYQVIPFVMMKLRAPRVVYTGFYINDKFSYVKWNYLNISLDNNLESTFIEVNLPKKGILSVGAFINTLICP